MKILVTGGAGFIGSNLIARLLKDKGATVISVDDFNDYYAPEKKLRNIEPFISNPNFKSYKANICDFEDMNKIFVQEKPDVVAHLAGRAGVRESITYPTLYESVNLGGTVNMLELAHQHKVKNFVFASSSSVYGDSREVPFSETAKTDEPVSLYAATKKAGEALCYSYHKLHGLPITCLRFFTVYGPGGRPDMAPYKFTKCIAEGLTLPKYGDGTTQRDYTYIDDIVQGIMAAIEKKLPFAIINLGNSATISLNDFIALIERLLGKKAKIDQMPSQPGDVEITYADNARAKELLGYEPTTSIEEGMKKFIKWYEQNETASSQN